MRPSHGAVSVWQIVSVTLRKARRDVLGTAAASRSSAGQVVIPVDLEANEPMTVGFGTPPTRSSHGRPVATKTTVAPPELSRSTARRSPPAGAPSS